MASSREVYESKQEGDDERFSKASSSSSIPRQWSSGFNKNPRIVRVARSFGGKDRHSKVCTIRGLRDRRIRLSVPTAVELYDLQDKLGLNQPSKVVDWLLEATKLDIDKLPPLQFPHGFSQFHHQQQPETANLQQLPYHESNLSLGPLYDYSNNLMGKSSSSRFWDNVDSSSSSMSRVICKGKEIKTNYDAMPLYNNNYHHSSDLSSTQFGSHHGALFHSQFPSSLFGNSQLLFGSTPTPQPSIFTPTTTAVENNNDPRQFNFLNSVSSHHQQYYPLIPSSFHSLINSPIRPLATPFNSKLLNTNENKDSNADARS